MLDKIRARGVKICFVTLHVGLGTFAPVKTETLAEHKMHEERFEVGEETVRAVNEAKKSGHRVIAVGTTSVRVLESVAAQNGGKLNVQRVKRASSFFRRFNFKIVDALLTNFHLPCSTLLMLVERVRRAGRNRAGAKWFCPPTPKPSANVTVFSATAMRCLFYEVKNPKTKDPKLPFVFVNMAMTADGKIATANRAVHSFGSARDLGKSLRIARDGGRGDVRRADG